MARMLELSCNQAGMVTSDQLNANDYVNKLQRGI